MNIANCIIHGEGEMYSVEVTHRCASRRLLYEELVRMLPGFLRENDVYWFRTRNPGTNIHHTCLFEGAELEMQLVTSHIPECGFCFARQAFIPERDAFDQKQSCRMASSESISSPSPAMQAEWAVREPSDTERLQVNRHGWEIMFVLRPQDGAVTVSRLRAELGRLLSISDLRRILLTSGPFTWGPDYQEDGKDYFSTYFVHDHVSMEEGSRSMRSMKTARGSALISSFKRSEHLKRHVRRHTKEKPFRCRVCGENFSRKELHDRHQRTKHGATSDLPLPQVVDPAGPSIHEPSSMVGEAPRQPLYFPAGPSSPFPYIPHNDEAGVRQESPITSPLGNETPPWLKLPTGLELMSLFSALNRSPLSTSGLPSPLRLCTPQAEALFEQDRNESARLGIEKALEGLMTIETTGPEDAAHRFPIPGMESLYRYWHMFFDIPHHNLPFAHPKSYIYQIPAIAIGVLADGAMYCDETAVGQMLFEASRRLVANYMNTHQGGTIPIWVFTTLLLNCVFGLPGGESQGSDITLGSLDSLINLARVIESGPPMDSVDQASTVEEKWRSYIEAESHRRSILCFIVVSGLWSVAYEPIVNVLDFPFSLIEFPWSETLWNARSVSQWQCLWRYPEHRSSGSWSENVEALLFGKPRPFNGLASLCLVVGLLLYIDGIHREATLDPHDMNLYLQRALDKWWAMHDRTSPENLAINHLCYPAAYYLRISLCLDVRKTMNLMRENEFSAMRKVLREGDLSRAASFARAAMIPWVISRRNQSSMAAIPCGIVITEWATNVFENHYGDSFQMESLKAFEESIRAYWPVAPLDSPLAVWTAIRKIVANGPVTTALGTSMDSYEVFLTMQQTSRV
ncbi:hypothetical protein FE257_011450 [Aspergillus nanangensis]|uniref:C2H2-type domain-containing protein n=1 Tax=Aspergillus nanangensis TaxID=2582783 RepID=A0AAD4CHM9_ASPNN|nr:hypothetical protein FE257_011450 [Aspergillus nanangensis]